MKIEDIGVIIKNFLSKEDSYISVLVDDSWGCGKTTQIRKSIKEIKNKKVIYVSLFGIKSTDELIAILEEKGLSFSQKQRAKDRLMKTTIIV